MVFKLLSLNRLHHKTEFDQVFNQRNRLYGRYFMAYYLNSQRSHPRIGIIASKRNLSRAVDRNRVRRILKEQFRLAQQQLPHWDVVFVVKKGISNVQNQELRQCCDELLNQLSVLYKRA